MSAELTTFTLPRILEQSANSIFFEKTPRVVDEDSVSTYSSSQKTETLIKELLRKGPLVALGGMGPGCYVNQPFKLKNKVCEQDIYGWKPGTQRTAYPRNGYWMIVGAKKIADRGYVYFTMAEDHTQNQKTYIREYRPSNTDTKIYITSHKTFRNYLCDLYPPLPSSKSKPEADRVFIGDPSLIHPNLLSQYAQVVGISSTPSQAPKLTEEQLADAQKLVDIKSIDAILDRGSTESFVKKLGQELFDKYKMHSFGESMSGRRAVIDICKWIAFNSTDSRSDARKRKDHIEFVWDGIGDKNWTWRR